MLKVKNLETDGNRVDFDIYSTEMHKSVHYHTNNRGEGLWDGYDYMNQIEGTCDFNLHQTTDSGKRKAIKRHFRIER